MQFKLYCVDVYFAWHVSLIQTRNLSCCLINRLFTISHFIANNQVIKLIEAVVGSSQSLPRLKQRLTK